MSIKKFFVVMAAVGSMQLSAMEEVVTQKKASVAKPDKTVEAVVVQVRPSYVLGTRIFKPVSSEESKRHDQALTQVANACLIRSLSHVQDAGLYYISFMQPISLAFFQEQCKQLPGFEKAYAADEYQDDELKLKDKIFDHRMHQLGRLKQLWAFKTLSASQLGIPKQQTGDQQENKTEQVLVTE